jgi:hypothetical protein
MTGDPDAISNTVDNLLRTCVEERLTVLQRPLFLPDGRFSYLIRVPASPLAPHMIANINTSSPRFFSRANTANQPMTVREIKEVAMKHGGAVERAAARIRERVRILEATGQERDEIARHPTDPLPNQAVLHLVPLFPHSDGWNYSDPARADRLDRVQPIAMPEPAMALSYTQHGAFQDLEDYGHTGFLRDGSLEFHEFDVLERRDVSTTIRFVASFLEEAIDLALTQSQMLSEEDLLPTPLLVQLHLLSVRGARFLRANRETFASNNIINEDVVATDALVLTEWAERANVLRKLLDHLWQAWGYPRCLNYDVDGVRMRFSTGGQRMP